MRKTIFEIMEDREIIPLEPAESLGETFLQWRLKGIIWGDKIEELLENGYSVMVDSGIEVIVSKQFGETTPQQLRDKKQFFENLSNAIGD